jgi:hypothetical protein
MGDLRTGLARWQAKQETKPMNTVEMRRRPTVVDMPQHIEVATYPGQGRIEKAQRTDGGYTYHFTTTTRLNDHGDVARCSVRDMTDDGAKTAWPRFMRDAKTFAQFAGQLGTVATKHKLQDVIINVAGGVRGKCMTRSKAVRAEVVAPPATVSPDTVTLAAIRAVSGSGVDPVTKEASIALLLAGERQTKSAAEILADNAWTQALDAATRK